MRMEYGNSGYLQKLDDGKFIFFSNLELDVFSSFGSAFFHGKFDYKFYFFLNLKITITKKKFGSWSEFFFFNQIFKKRTELILVKLFLKTFLVLLF